MLKASEVGTSKHLKPPAQSGLVMAERDGYFVMDRLSPHALSDLKDCIGQSLEVPCSGASETCPRLCPSSGSASRPWPA